MFTKNRLTYSNSAFTILPSDFITKEDIGTIKRIEDHYKSNITELPSDFDTSFKG